MILKSSEMLDVNEEKELLKAMLMSLEIPMENSTKFSSLIDMGFTASQIAIAIMKANTYGLEHLIDRITDETRGKLRTSI